MLPPHGVWVTEASVVPCRCSRGNVPSCQVCARRGNADLPVSSILLPNLLSNREVPRQVEPHVSVLSIGEGSVS